MRRNNQEIKDFLGSKEFKTELLASSMRVKAMSQAISQAMKLTRKQLNTPFT